jgi:hypothetical protein
MHTNLEKIGEASSVKINTAKWIFWHLVQHVIMDVFSLKKSTVQKKHVNKSNKKKI